MEGLIIITLAKYKGQKPTDGLIKEELIKERSYSYIVATKALQRERENIIPQHQNFEDYRNSKEISKAVFKEVLKEWTKSRYNLASSGETKMVLMRTIEKVTGPNKELSMIYDFRKRYFNLAKSNGGIG